MFYSLAALLIYAVIFSPWCLHPNWTQNLLLKTLFSPQVFFIVASIIIFKIRPLQPSKIGFHLKNIKKNILIGIGIGFIPALLSIGIIVFFHLLSHDLLGGKAILSNYSWISWCSLLILAPLSEELFFRGVFLEESMQKSSVTVAITMSSFLFMATHGSFFHWGALILGFVTAILRFKTHSLIPGIVYHFIANLYVPALAYFFPKVFLTLQKVL